MLNFIHNRLRLWSSSQRQKALAQMTAGTDSVITGSASNAATLDTLLTQHTASSEEEYGEVGPELRRNITARSAKGFFGSFFSYQLHTKG